MKSANHEANQKAVAIGEKYVKALKKRGVLLERVLLFGSHARGTAGPDSDIDLLVVVNKLDSNVREIIIEEAFNLSIEENEDVIAVPCDSQEFNSPVFRADGFYKNVQSDGVVIA